MFVPVILTLLASSAYAQFQFFEQMFGGHQQQQHHQQRPTGDTSQWAAHSEQVPCSRYLCPTTLVCVNNPVECPCPNVEDVKCTIPDWDEDEGATVICVRGEGGCAQVDKLLKAGGKK